MELYCVRKKHAVRVGESNLLLTMFTQKGFIWGW